MTDGTSTSSGRWIKTSYPEIDTEPLNLIPEIDLTSQKDNEGI